MNDCQTGHTTRARDIHNVGSVFKTRIPRRIRFLVEDKMEKVFDAMNEVRFKCADRMVNVGII